MNSKAYRRKSIKYRILYPIQWTRRFTRDILDWLTEKLQEIFLEEEVEFVQSAPGNNIRTSSFSSKQGITSGKRRLANTNDS
jgi:mRNA-degrading endonuclease RelE of RelBE toxin-antitoxin system